MDFLADLFASDFVPRGQSYLWRSEILWLHAASDGLMVLAYLSIPFALLGFVRRRPGVSFGRLSILLGAFLCLCAVTHLLEIWTHWNGSYRLQGLVKLLTAGVSLATAAALWGVLPKALALPGAAELEAVNAELRAEIGKRQAMEEQLRSVQAHLEDRATHRTRELEDVNQALKREIVEREKAEERFRSAVDSAWSGMVMSDAEGKMVLVNRTAERLFGYERGELLGRQVEELLPEALRETHREDRARFMASPTIRAMGAGRDIRGRRKDGEDVPVEIRLNPIQTSDGTFVLSSIIDITERKQSHSLLEAKTRELERSNSALDEFAHVVSHDLKAPLRGIASLASWIVEDSLPALSPESREHLALLSERTKRMSRMIEGILDYSRSGRSAHDDKGVDSRAVVEEVIDSLAPPETLRVRIEGRMPILYYDWTQLAQVFQNLIDNAIQHHGKPRGEVVVSCTESPEQFEFSVRDDGVGIPERHHQRIFRIFQVLEPDPERRHAGIGLAVVKRIVELHGGAVSVESVPGAGTTFRFSVPKRRDRPPGDPA